jgi:hypothetical protein
MFFLCKGNTMTQTEAINKMLGYIGSHPVDNYLASNNPEIARALVLLEEKLNSIQRQGYWFNTFYNVTYYPDNNGNIVVSSGDVNDLFVKGRPELQLINYTLVDTKTNSITFTEPVVADYVIREYEFDNCPKLVRELATYMAAEEFVIMELEDTQRAQHLRQKWASLHLELQREKVKRSQHNIFDRPIVQRVRYGVRPYHGRRIR